MENRNYLKIFALIGIFALAFPLASRAAYITAGTSYSQWINDTNGIYYPGNIGVGAASVISGAKVLIASSTSAEGLRIISSATYAPLVVRNSSDTADLFRVDQFGNITGGNAAAWSLNGTSLYPANTSYNVGIGTTNPGTYKLNVVGNTYLNGDATINGGDLSINNNNGGINFNDSSAYWLKTATSWGIYWDTSANQIKFNGGGTTRSFIDLDDGAAYFNGNVGIGITNPTDKLQVSGGYVSDVTGKLARNLLDTSTWTVGTGAVGSWGCNGSTAECERVWDTDPFGRRSLVWTGTNDSTSDADGGWNYNNIPVDNNKAYRLTVWIKKDSNASGSFYLGLSGSNTNNLSDVANTNPYFFSSGWSGLQANRWYLAVGYIHANNDPSTTSYSAVYDGVTGKKVMSGTDYKNRAANNFQTHRTYNYYDTTTGSHPYFWGPRFEEINGSEPSIESLLGVSQSATIPSAAYFGDNIGIGTTSLSAKIHFGAMTGDAINVSGGKIVNVNAPVDTGDAVNKKYVDDNFQPKGAYGTVSGSGTVNYIPKWSATSSLSNSLFYDNGTNIGIGTTNPRAKLEIGADDGIMPSIVSGSVIEVAGYREVAQSADITITGGTLVGGGPTSRNGIGYWNITGYPSTITINTRGWWTYPGISFTAENVHNYPSGGGNKLPASFLVEASPDGTTWTTVDDVTGYTSALYYKNNVLGGSGRYIRITARAAQSGETTSKIANIQIFDTYRVGKGPFTVSPEGNAVFIGGNVGIGAINPLQKLQVGTNTSASSSAPDTLSLGASYSNTAGANAKLRLYDTGSGVPYGLGVSSASFDSIVPSGAAFNWYVNGANKMTLNSSGYLGIGTTAPDQKLQVAGNIRLPVTGGKIAFGSAGASPSDYLMLQDIASPNPALEFMQDGASKFVIQGVSGNVGIGTTNPTAKLYINGGTGDVLNAGGGKIANVNTPVNTGDAVNKKYVDDNFQVKGNYATGTGTAGYVARWNSSSNLSNGSIYDNGTNVGVGTTIPGSYKLNVAGSAYVSGTLNGMYLNQGAGNYDQGLRVPSFSGYSLIGLNTTGATSTNADSFWMIYNNTEASTNFGFNGYQKSTTAFSVNKSNIVSFTNNVGIGTTNPATMLELSKSSTSESPVLRLSQIYPSDAANNQVGAIEFYRSEIDNGGLVRAKIEALSERDDDRNTGIAFYVQPTNGSATEAVRIANTGFVGIGTTAPGANLDIAGTIKISGGSPGAGKVLTSDASGLASWTTPAAGGVTSVTSTDGTLTISPNTGAVGASLNLAKANTWTAAQTFNASTTFPGSGIWNSSGKVGIGTTAPGQGSLQISRDISEADYSNSGNAQLVIQGATDSTDRLNIGFETANRYGFIDTLDYGSDWNDPLVLQRKGGNVGIGTTSPTSKLHVIGTTYLNGAATINGLATISTGIELSTGGGRYISYYGSTTTGYFTAMQTTATSGYGTYGPVTADWALYNRFNGVSNRGWIWQLATTNVAALSGQGNFQIAGNFNSLGTSTNSFAGNVGIGTTSPSAKLYINGGTGTALNMGGGIISNMNTPSATTDAATKGYVDSLVGSSFLNGGNSFAAAATLGTNDNYNLNFETNNAARMTIYNNGNVGIGTTSPAVTLDVYGGNGPVLQLRSKTGTDSYVKLISTSGVGLGYFGVRGATNRTFFSGTNAFEIQKYGTTNSLFFVDTDDAGGNAGNVGIGTTNPGAKLTINSSLLNSYPFAIYNSLGNKSLELYEDAQGDGWLRNYDSAGTEKNRIRPDGDNYITGGNVGIGTTSPTALLAVAGAVKANSITVTGKVTAATFDPPYTISGRKYATYASGMTGVKEETSGVAKLSLLSKKSNLYYHQLDLFDADRDSDLWLFSKTANLEKEGLADLSVLLTPRFSGRVWYEKNEKAGRVTIYATPDSKDSKLEVSYRLTAPRFDFREHGNTRPDDDNIEGLNLDNLR